MMYMCTFAFKHLFLHEPVLNSNLNSTCILFYLNDIWQSLSCTLAIDLAEGRILLAWPLLPARYSPLTSSGGL